MRLYGNETYIICDGYFESERVLTLNWFWDAKYIEKKSSNDLIKQ